MSKNNNSNGGIGFFGMLTILFIGLKLTGYIDWSWWLVLLPAYGGLAFIFAIGILGLIGIGIGALSILFFELFKKK